MFARPTLAEHLARAEQRKAANMAGLMVPSRAITRPTYAGGSSGVAVAKSPRAENRAVLNLARMQPCLLQSPVCQPDPETTVACHGAGVGNGKGMSYKVGDEKTVWGCWRCNDYTDAYKGATAEEKAAVFAAGHVRQVEAWAAIASDPMARPWKRKAAQWALDRLNATEIGTAA